VDEGSGLKGLAGFFLGHFCGGELAELFIDKWQELLGGVGIAGFNL